MTDANMNHLNHLAEVLDADKASVLEKERTYRGSWKRRGGVGAFMMLARKWDRLEQMMEATWGYDVLGALEHEADTGEDGSVLAEVRDLRRYLLLVEAEARSRFVARASEEGCDCCAPPRVEREAEGFVLGRAYAPDAGRDGRCGWRTGPPPRRCVRAFGHSGLCLFSRLPDSGLRACLDCGSLADEGRSLVFDCEHVAERNNLTTSAATLRLEGLHEPGGVRAATLSREAHEAGACDCSERVADLLRDNQNLREINAELEAASLPATPDPAQAGSLAELGLDCLRHLQASEREREALALRARNLGQPDLAPHRNPVRQQLIDRLTDAYVPVEARFR